MSTYDNLRRQCRTLESLLDAKLTSYSRLAANAEQEDLEASGSADRWRDLEEEALGLRSRHPQLASGPSSIARKGNNARAQWMENFKKRGALQTRLDGCSGVASPIAR